MNKIYKVVWNAARGCYVVASEFASAKDGYAAMSAKTVREVIHKVAQGAVVALAGFVILSSGGLVYAAEPTAANTVKHQYVVFAAESISGDAYVTKNDQILYTRTGRAGNYTYNLYDGNSSGTLYARNSNGTGNYTEYNGGTTVGTDIYKYNRVQLKDIDGSDKYYMVRDGYQAEINRGARHSLAANERLIDVVWTGNGTPPEDLLTSVASTNSFTGTQTNLGKELEQVHATMYAGASNSGGTQVNGAWNYIITEDDGHKDMVGGQGGVPQQFMTTSNSNNRLQWDENLQSYKYDGQLVPQQNVYVIGNSVGVFTKKDGSLYTGDVYGINNELLRTTVQDGQYYSYWAADVTDPTLTMKDYPVVEYNEDLKALENNDEKLAQNDINHIKVAKTSADGAANTTASIAAYRNGDDMKGTENDTNLVDGQVNLKESGGTGGIADNGANDRKMSVSVTNRTVAADGTVSTSETPVADFSLGSRVGDSSDVTEDGNLKKLTINGQSYGMKTFLKGNNADEATVEANLGDTIYVQGSDTNAEDKAGNNNIVVTAENSTAGKKLNVALNEHVKINELTAGVANGETNSTAGKINIVRQDGETQSITAVEKDGDSVTEDRLQYTGADNTAHVLATTDDGMKFKGDDATVISKKMNDQLNITGGATGELSDGNIGVTSDNGNLKVQLAKDVKDLNTVTAGTAVLGKDTDGKSYVKGLDNKTWEIGKTEAVSGRAATEDQLKVVSDGVNTNTQNITNVTNTVNSGWNAKVGDTSINVNPTKNTLTFKNGDNITLTPNTADSSITVGTTPVAGFTTVHVGGSGTGSNMTGGITLGNQAATTTKNSTENGLYITGLENKTWTAGNYVDGRAATENQLQALQEQINQTHTIATAAGDTYISSGTVSEGENGKYDIQTKKATTTRDANGNMGNPVIDDGPTITGLHDYYVTSGSVNKENGHLTLTRQNGTVDIDLSDVLGSDSDWHVQEGSYAVNDNGDVTLTLHNDADAKATDKQVTITGLQSKANANLSFAADTGTPHKVDAGGTQKIAGDTTNIHTSVNANGDIVVSLDANPSVNSITVNNNKITSNGDTLQYITNNEETKTIATTDDGLTFSGNTGLKVTRKLGTELAVKGDSANENIRVTGTNDGLVIGLDKHVKVNTLTAGSIDGTDGLDKANGTISIVGNAKEGNKEYINVQAGYREAEKPVDPAKEGGDTDGITRLTYQGDKVRETGDVLGTPHVVATLEDGYKLSGDVTKNGTADATSVGLGLNKEISLKGGATADKLVADNYNNVGVTVTKEDNVGKINFQLNKDLDGLNTVTTRSATGEQGATLGNQTAASKSGKSETGSYVTKLSNTNWYTNQETGAGGSLSDNSIVSGRAATEDQLQAVQQELTQDIDRIDGKETNLTVNNQKATENSGNYVGKNLQLKYDTDKDGHIQNYDLKLADDLDVNSVTTGNTKMNTDGITITNTVDNTKNVTLTGSGLNNGGNKVTNVAKGDVNATSTDAINGSQLYEVQQNVNNGWTAKVGNDSINVTPSNNTLTFEAGDNIALSAKDSAITVATTPKAGFTELHVAGTGSGSSMTGGITLGSQSNLGRAFNKVYTETKYDTDTDGKQTGGYTVITYTQQAGADADKTVTYKGEAQHYAINGDKDDKLPSQYSNIDDVTVNKTEEGSGKYVTGLDNTGWNEHSYVSGRAATEDQLNQVAEQIRGQVSASDRYITKGTVVEDTTKNDGTYKLSFETSTNGPVDVENLHDYYVTGLTLDKTTGKLTLNQHDGVGDTLKELSVDMSDLQTSFDADSNTEHGNKANTPALGGTQKILGDTKNINTKVDKDGNIVVALASDPTVNSITIGDTKITNNKEGDHLTYETKEGDTTVTNTIATLGDGYKLAGDVTKDGETATTGPVGIDLGKAISLKGGATSDKLVADTYKNVGVTVTKNTDGSADVNFQLNKDLDGLNSVTMRNGEKVSTLGYQADGQKEEKGFYLTGLDNKTWNSTSYVSGRAATEDQLKAVQDNITNDTKTAINESRTAVTVNGGTAAPANGSYNTEGNLQLKKTTDANGKDTYDVKLADNLNVTSVTTGGTKIDNSGVTVNNKQYITNEGVNANDQKITNVEAGELSKDSKDAVNGSQLYNVDQKVNQNTENIKNIQGDVNNIKNDVKNVKELAGKHTTVTSSDETIKVTDTSKDKDPDQHTYDLSVDYGKIADHVADNVNLSYKANGKDAQQVTLKDGLNFTDGNGTVASVDKDGVVKYDLADDVVFGQPGEDGKDGKPGKPGKDGSIGLVGRDGKDGTTTTIIKTVGKNGTDGTNGTPGVNGKDGEPGITRIVYGDKNGDTEHTVATLDDGLKFAGDTGSAAVELNNKVSLTGGAKGALSDGNIGVDATQDGKNAKLTIQLAKDLTGMSSTTYTTSEGTTVVNGGGITIKGGDTNNNITIKQGDVNMGGNQIHNIAPGEAPNDAATVGQLNDSMTNVGHSLSKMNNRIDRVGAGAAALAGLHPQDFDPEDKWDFAAGYGHYRSANAMAVGAFYRPDEYTMFNIGGSFGGGENLLNAGLTIKLGKRDKDGLKLSRVAMAEQIRDLKATISMQEAKIQESDAREAEQNQRIAQLEAMVKALAAKQG